MKLPTRGKPADVLDALAECISEMIGQKSVARFYIGRWSDLDSIMSQHGCDNVVPLYETRSFRNAIEVQGSLVQRFMEHEKYSNEDSHGISGTPRGFVSYVYLALWYDLAVISR
jgi:hypothetical protein